MRPLAVPESDTRSDGPEGEALGSLVGAAARGDEAAWEAIVAAYGRRVFAMAHSRLRDPERAEEIAQSVFATLAEKLLGPGGAYTERGRFEAWLFRITMNRVRDEARRRARRAGDVPLTGGEVVSGTGRTTDERTTGLDALRGAMARLDAKDSEIISLRHHGGLAFGAIAEMLGQPLGTVLARHHRALKKLRDLLGDDAPGGQGDDR